MARAKTKVVHKVKVGKATLIEKELYINGEHDDTICVVNVGSKEIGGYTSIADAMHHKGEWCSE